MERVLHILRTEPDTTVAQLIDNLAGESWVTVTTLYDDGIAGIPIDWQRLVDDIFAHDQVICWW